MYSIDEYLGIQDSQHFSSSTLSSTFFEPFIFFSFQHFLGTRFGSFFLAFFPVLFGVLFPVLSSLTINFLVLKNLKIFQTAPSTNASPKPWKKSPNIHVSNFWTKKRFLSTIRSFSSDFCPRSLRSMKNLFFRPYIWFISDFCFSDCRSQMASFPASAINVTLGSVCGGQVSKRKNGSFRNRGGRAASRC